MERDRYVVLDDDPTGTQAVHDVPVFLRWGVDELRAALTGSPSVHLLTNARALTAADAEQITFDAATTAQLTDPRARLVLRGDSTLRGHLLPEYRGVVRAAFRDQVPVLMLVPALPAAGRVTRGGIHYASSIPVHETAYARDGMFTFTSSRLLEWAEERSAGLLRAAHGIEVPLKALRTEGSTAVADALRCAASRGGAAVAPDAETASDLELIAAGARDAYDQGLPLLVRAGPAFAGILTGTAADGFVAPPPRDEGLLVVCGSYVERTTAQLWHLYKARGITPVELDIYPFMSSDAAAADDAVARAASAVDERLAAGNIAVLATPRERPSEARSLDAGRRIASGLARVLPTISRLPGVILVKGGITSHVTLAEGLACDRAYVVGPIATGVARWRVSVGERELDYLIFPGNVGDDQHLADVVALILDS